MTSSNVLLNAACPLIPPVNANTAVKAITNFLFPVILDSSQIINRMFETKSVSLIIMYYFIDDFTNLNY